jgi:glycosyltransferase involved in cell wall biosynthesis
MVVIDSQAQNKEENYLSIVIVLRNNQDIVARKIEAVATVLNQNFKYFEIICVDNSSSDETAKRLRRVRLASTPSSFSGLLPSLPLTIISLSRTHTVQQALTAGVGLAIGDFIVEIPDITVDYVESAIMEIYRASLAGNDFVFLAPTKTRRSSKLFYRILNRYYRQTMSEQFTSSIMTLSSRRGQNKTADVGRRIINRNVSYLLTGLTSTRIPSNVASRNRRGFRENINLMADTLLYYTDYFTNMVIGISLLSFALSLLIGIYSVLMRLTAETAPGWASTVSFSSVAFGAVFLILGAIMKNLSLILRTQDTREYVFFSVERVNQEKRD